ncbi:CLIP domain-containing serine protease HP8-like [Chironomus tepperi]|uniref:CLIP domain-containing serine protease HP8-like n=1 Tax=Chironomus tepperi TaxID=113505 RepID=UPI00391F1051
MSVANLHFIHIIIIVLAIKKVFGEFCRSPNNEQGSCIPLVDCESLKKLLPLARQSEYYRTYLIKSQCKVSRVPWVCCPSPKNDEFKARNNFFHQIRLPLASEGVCGRAYAPDGSLPNRVVGGEETYVGEFPWYALLAYYLYEFSKVSRIGYYCGGSLITSMHVLTAAHCTSLSIIPPNWNLSKVRLGETDLTLETDCEWSFNAPYCSYKPIDVDIEKIFSHELYNSQQGSQNDIALIKLKEKVQFNAFVKPICLPVDNKINTDYGSGIIAGFGKTETRNLSDVLLKTEIDIVDLEDCIATYSAFNRHVGDSQICAVGRDSDSCKGDSGGGFIMQDDSSAAWYLIGIISYGSRRCRSEYPGVHVKVGNYIDWIKNKLND